MFDVTCEFGVKVMKKEEKDGQKLPWWEKVLFYTATGRPAKNLFHTKHVMAADIDRPQPQYYMQETVQGPQDTEFKQIQPWV